jgi:hypothetical protein
MPGFSLDTIDVASPCPAEWSAMAGDERRRFCTQCGKHVHNLSAMTAIEIEQLLEEDRNRCVRFYRDEDGSVWTAGRVPRPPVSRRSTLAIALSAAVTLLPDVARAKESKKSKSSQDEKTKAPPEESKHRVVTLKSLLEGRRVTTMNDVRSDKTSVRRTTLLGMDQAHQREPITGAIYVFRPGQEKKEGNVQQ